MNEERRSSRLSKSQLMKEAPIFCDTLHDCEPYDPGTAFARLYTHDVIELSVVTAGSGIHQILNQPIPCRAGDIYVCRGDVPHGYFAGGEDGDFAVRRLFFDVRDWFDGEVGNPDHVRFCYGVFRDNAQTAYAMLDARTQDEVGALLDGIAHEAVGGRREWRDGIRSYLAMLLITVGRVVSGATKSIPECSPKDGKALSFTLQVVAQRCGDSSLTLESIARELFISKSQLSRIFGRLTGSSFAEYLRSVRVTRACDLLCKTDLTVEEVTKQCGMKDVPTFYRVFRTHTGMTPNQYRHLYRADQNTKPNGERIMIVLSEISENLQKGKAKIVKEMVAQALEEGCSAIDIMNEGLLSGMSVIGEKFKKNEVYVPEVLVAARAMNMGMEVLKPYLAESGVKATGRVCIGTVRGDLHDIGKNLVKMMMEGKGLEVVDLGTDVSAETFISTAVEQDCRIICCSALLTTTMDVMREVVEAAEKAGIRDKVKIMIGGAPVSEDYCRKIGADAYTVDAASAADAAVAFCKA